MTATRWCPSCGAEYKPYVDECSDCAVALVDDPPRRPQPGELSTDHHLAEWELRDWAEEDLRSVFGLLNSKEIRYEWDVRTETLKTNHLDEVAVDDLLALFDSGKTSDEPAALPSDQAPSVRRRMTAFVIDFVALVVVWTFTAVVVFGVRSGDRTLGVWASAMVPVIGFAYYAVTVAVWGRTMGKQMLDLRVVDDASDAKPSALRAGYRAAVPWAVIFVPFVGPLTWLVVYGAALFNPERRGLHDRLSGTRVVELATARHFAGQPRRNG